MNKLSDILQKDSFTKRAVIREDECIGCTKCTQACPFDSIIGASKLMHTVITDVCTGCGLCVPPCPVDCIDMIVLNTPQNLSETEERKIAEHYRQRFEFREQRLSTEKKSHSVADKKRFIAEALARTNAKKGS